RVAGEGGRRLDGEMEEAGAAARFVQWPRGERRVAIDRLQMIGDVPIRVMLQLAPELSDRAAHGDRLVHVRAGPFGGAPVVEPKLIIGIPVGGANPAAEM